MNFRFNVKLSHGSEISKILMKINLLTLVNKNASNINNLSIKHVTHDLLLLHRSLVHTFGSHHPKKSKINVFNIILSYKESIYSKTILSDTSILTKKRKNITLHAPNLSKACHYYDFLIFF